MASIVLNQSESSIFGPKYHAVASLAYAEQHADLSRPPRQLSLVPGLATSADAGSRLAFLLTLLTSWVVRGRSEVHRSMSPKRQCTARGPTRTGWGKSPRSAKR